MVGEANISIKNLIEEATREAYSPRAKKCWPWSHAWTMYKLGEHPTYRTITVQSRRCVRCGRLKVRGFW